MDEQDFNDYEQMNRVMDFNLALKYAQLINPFASEIGKSVAAADEYKCSPVWGSGCDATKVGDVIDALSQASFRGSDLGYVLIVAHADAASDEIFGFVRKISSDRVYCPQCKCEHDATDKQLVECWPKRKEDPRADKGSLKCQMVGGVVPARLLQSPSGHGLPPQILSLIWDNKADEDKYREWVGKPLRFFVRTHFKLLEQWRLKIKAAKRAKKPTGLVGWLQVTNPLVV